MATIHVNKAGYGVGTSGDDMVYGNNGTNVLAGGKGSDALWGRGGADLIGGAQGNDNLYGGAGDDILIGGTGRDTLTGGAGHDAFVFDARPSRAAFDTITDFKVNYDQIWLDKSIFTALGETNTALSEDAFWKGSRAHDSSDHIIYNQKTGIIYYDPDANGSRAAVPFAKIKAGLALTYKDFLVLDI